MYLNDDFNLRHLTLRIGTDCSGLDTPVVALNLLGVNVIHKWSCDNDSDIKKQILNTFEPEKFYDDIFERDVNALEPVDLYVCGMPCQSFSIANSKRQGFEIKHGTIFFEAFKVIQHLEPQYFILENVKGVLSHNKGETFTVIKEHLEQLTQYSIFYKQINTMDYGVPQNRPRLYIIGVKNRYIAHLTIPTVPRYDLSCFIDSVLPPDPNALIPRRREALDWAVKTYNIDLKDNWVINIGASVGTFISAMQNITPCLITFCPYFYLTAHHRFLSPRELLALQGFPDQYQLISCKSKQYKQIGNAMSCNVLYHILYRVLTLESES